MKSVKLTMEEKKSQHAQTQSTKSGMPVSEPTSGRPSLFTQENSDASECEKLAGRSVAERSTSLLSKTLEEFDARGVGLKMTDNLPRDDLYRCGRIPTHRDQTSSLPRRIAWVRSLRMSEFACCLVLPFHAADTSPPLHDGCTAEFQGSSNTSIKDLRHCVNYISFKPALTPIN